MTRTPPLIFRVLIGVFCLWHMAALALYTIPSDIGGFFGNLQSAASPLTRPYILSLSQWQQWNLFSPDPMRRITHYRVDAMRDGLWSTRVRITPQSFPMRSRSTWQKYFMNLLAETGQKREPLQRRFLEYQCRELGLKSGTQARLVLERSTLPKDDWIHSQKFWNDKDLDVTEITATTIVCPS